MYIVYLEDCQAKSPENHMGQHTRFWNISIGPVKQNFGRKNVIILLSISLNMCFGWAQKNHLIEMVLLSTHNQGFR